MIGGSRVRIATTGYTGEDGFELIADQGEMPHLWERILSEGKRKEFALLALGHGHIAHRDGIPLYGHELSEEIDPLQAGLSFFVDLQKTRFRGKECLGSKEKQGIGSMQCCFSHAGKISPTTSRIPCS